MAEVLTNAPSKRYTGYSGATTGCGTTVGLWRTATVGVQEGAWKCDRAGRLKVLTRAEVLTEVLTQMLTIVGPAAELWADTELG